MTQRIGDEVGEATTLMNICRLYFAQGNYEQIPALAEPAWQLASKLELWDTAAKLCWLSGDLAFVSGDFQVCFYHYHYACVPASVYGDQLLQATIDRVESYLRQLPGQQASAFCQAFQQKPDAIDPTIWQPIQTYLYELETRLISQAAG
jgi:hypothetical protein